MEALKQVCLRRFFPLRQRRVRIPLYHPHNKADCRDAYASDGQSKHTIGTWTNQTTATEPRQPLKV